MDCNITAFQVRQVFIRQSTTHSLFSAFVHSDRKHTNLDRKPVPSSALSTCISARLPLFSPFPWLSVRLAGPSWALLDSCDECALLYCWAWTWSAQRTTQAYLCNEKYEPVSQGFVNVPHLRYCTDALWQLSEKLDGANVWCWTVTCEQFPGPTTWASVKRFSLSEKIG